MPEVVIAGGGAAGMFAALLLSDAGANVKIVEKNQKTGLKLGITGKGRCNLTNNCDNENFFANLIHGSKFMRGAYSKFTSKDTMEFFEYRLGIPLKTERGNRVFPESDRALDIVNALRDALRENNVEIIHGRANKIICENRIAKGIFIDGNRQVLSNHTIIATGGITYPKTGSTGDGYKMAKEVGHSVTPLYGVLNGIRVCQNEMCTALAGLSLKNIKLSLFDGSKKIFSEIGEMLFTHMGVSGPLVLKASCYIDSQKIKDYKIEIDLKPGLDEKKLDLRLLREFSEGKNRNISNIMKSLLPERMIPYVLKRAGIQAEIKANSITHEMRQNLIKVLKSFELLPFSLEDSDTAVITAGGIKTDEINPKSMESKLVKNLYFIGEILDVHGFTGGYNLQICFSTANAAAEDIIKS